jgi:hypothetical protein
MVLVSLELKILGHMVEKAFRTCQTSTYQRSKDNRAPNGILEMNSHFSKEEILLPVLNASLMADSGSGFWLNALHKYCV